MEKGIRFSHNHPSKISLQFAFTHPLKTEGKIKQVEIKHVKNGKWYAYFTREVESPEYVDNGLYYAVDLGVSNLITGINLHLRATQIKNRRADLYWRKKISQVQSKRDHCKKESHLWLRYTKTLQRMKRKCATQMRDYQHFIAKKVVENTKANTIILGDLSAKRMACKKKGSGVHRITKARKTLNHSLHNTGSIGRFIEFLTYKAEKVGKRVIRIDESYTSRACCICGKLHNMPLSTRIMNCNCGNQLDRDINSAINIMKRFLQKKYSCPNKYDFLLHQPSMTEESFLKRMDLLRHTAPSLPSAGDGGLAVS
jgi:putative transposase